MAATKKKTYIENRKPVTKTTKKQIEKLKPETRKPQIEKLNPNRKQGVTYESNSSPRHASQIKRREF